MGTRTLSGKGATMVKDSGKFSWFLFLLCCMTVAFLAAWNLDVELRLRLVAACLVGVVAFAGFLAIDQVTDPEEEEA